MAYLVALGKNITIFFFALIFLVEFLISVYHSSHHVDRNLGLQKPGILGSIPFPACFDLHEHRTPGCGRVSLTCTMHVKDARLAVQMYTGYISHLYGVNQCRSPHPKDRSTSRWLNTKIQRDLVFQVKLCGFVQYAVYTLKKKKIVYFSKHLKETIAAMYSMAASSSANVSEAENIFRQSTVCTLIRAWFEPSDAISVGKFQDARKSRQCDKKQKIILLFEVQKKKKNSRKH